MIEDLKKYLINKDKPNGINNSGWYAGGQLDALRYYFDEKVKIIAEYMEDNYQGECSALLFVDNKYFLWRDSFGSCSGCDGLEDENGYEYIEDTMTSVKEFDKLESVIDYLSSKDRDFLYSDEVSNELKSKIKSTIRTIGCDRK